ncbi:hypothetical protein Tco_0164471 [Tanacetum coccineum]
MYLLVVKNGHNKRRGGAFKITVIPDLVAGKIGKGRKAKNCPSRVDGGVMAHIRITEAHCKFIKNRVVLHATVIVRGLDWDGLNVQ